MNFLYVALALVALMSVASSSNLGYFLHFSDTHVERDYLPKSDHKQWCREGSGDVGVISDFNCYTHTIVIENAAKEMLKAPSECPGALPLFVLWTGDSAGRFKGKHTKESVIGDLEHLTKVFRDTFISKKIPVFPVIGNHDAYPLGDQSVKKDWVYSEVAKLWKGIIPDDSLNRLSIRGCYTAPITKGLRIIVLNTNLWASSNNLVNHSVEDPGWQINWLNDTLHYAKAHHEAVFIAGHIPPLHASSFDSKIKKKVLVLMKEFQPIIKGSFWGHDHIDMYQLIGTNTAIPSLCHVGHLAPSITPWHGWKGQEYVGTNPAYRQYIMNITDFTLLKWRTKYMDLRSANKKGVMEWNTLVDSYKDYHMKDLTPSSVYAFTKEMEKDNNLFQLFVKNLHADGHVDKCDATCHKEYICSILHPLQSYYEECLKK